jgi:AcrR family transcriptional regulator
MRTRPSSARRRQAILTAALEVFCEHGFEGATMEQIQDRSGASMGSIYHHFGNKDALATSLYIAAYAEFAQAVRDSLHAEPSPDRSVRAAAVLPLTLARSQPARARFLFGRSSARVLPDAQSQLERIAAGLINDVEVWIRPHTQSGSLRSISAPIYLSVWCGPSADLARRWLCEGPYWDSHLDEAEEAFADAAWRASATG